MKKNKSKKRTRKIILVIKAIIRLIDKKIITPITKFILLITDKMSKRTDKFERWLVKKNTLVFISLLISIVAFLAIDNKSISLVDSYAEVLYDQKVEAIYNTETYVIEGLPETVDVTLIGRKVDMYLAKQLSKEMNAKHFFSGYKIDIHHYFDDVNIETIEKQLTEINSGSKLDDLLWELYHDDRIIVNGKLIHRHRGLIQGCAFACLLANLVLKDIDTRISNMRVIYYRYSDDIIILGREGNVERAKLIISKMLEPKGLKLHPKKVQKIMDFHWFEFLGFSFTGDKISVSKKTLKNVRQLFFELLHFLQN